MAISNIPVEHGDLTKTLEFQRQIMTTSINEHINGLIRATRDGVYPEDLKKSTDAAANQLMGSVSVSASNEALVAAAKPATKRFIPWGATVSAPFLSSVLWIESQTGLNASYLIACMKFESGLNPQARNPGSSATGLIQFMDATAKRLGTTTQALFEMSGVQQLNYVYKYFLDYQKRNYLLSAFTLEDTYMAILWPAGIGKELDYKVFVAHSEAYKVNSGLDLDHDGYVTKREACARVRALFDEGMKPGKVMVI